MAKQIKALKCPQCGSTKKQEGKEDHYICNNCGTEYFLDNDDINVNVRHQNAGVFPAKPVNTKLILGVVAAAIFLFVFILMFIGSFTHRSGSGSSGTLPGISGETVRERIKTYFVMDGKAGNPVVVFFVERSYYRRNLNKPNTYLMRFFDPIKGETMKDVEMKEWNDNTALYYHRVFSDGNFYIIPRDETTIYKIDGVRQTITTVNNDFFDAVPEFSSGIASLEFRSKSYGDGLQIMTNDGTEYFYYPLVKQVYKGRDELSEAYEKIQKQKGSMSDKIYYAFTDKSTDYRDEKIQLIKFWYKETAGGLVDIPTRPTWRKSYQYPKGPGIFVGNFKYTKVLFGKKGRVSKFENLTPDRLYFEPKIVYQNGEELYITGYPNANTNGTKFLQSIDVNTGEVLWNYKPTLTDYEFRSDVFHFKNGIACNVSGKVNNVYQNNLVFLGKDGKVIKEIDMQKLFK